MDVAILGGDPGGWRLTEAGELIRDSGGGDGLRSSVWGDDPEAGAKRIAQMAEGLGISSWEWEE